MTDNELILTISDLMDKKLCPINNRLQKVEISMGNLETKVDKRFEEVDKRFTEVDKRFEEVDKRFEKIDSRFEEVDSCFKEVAKCFEAIEKRFEENEQNVKRISLIQETEVLPRLKTIEECYLSTYKRYQQSAERTEAMQVDIDIMKKVLIEHSQILKQIS